MALRVDICRQSGTRLSRGRGVEGHPVLSYSTRRNIACVPCQPTFTRHAVGRQRTVGDVGPTASAGDIEMQFNKLKHAVHTILVSGLTAGVAACGGGSGSAASSETNTTPAPQAGKVAVLVSDASSDDWSTIGVKILSIALIPQGGGAPVTVFTAPATRPVVNL